MGGLDSFFKAYEQEQFWPLIDAIRPALAARHPDRPTPETISPEAVQVPIALERTDLLLRLFSPASKTESFVLLENNSSGPSRSTTQTADYILPFYSRYRPLVAILLHVTPDAVRKDTPAIEVVTVDAEPVADVACVSVRFFRIVLGKVLPPIADAPLPLLPLYMVQQKRLPSTKNTATVEKLLKDVVIPKLGAMPDEHSRKELSGYIIWGLSARHETLANLAMELFMKAFKQEYTDSPFYRWGLEKGQAEGREEGR